MKVLLRWILCLYIVLLGSEEYFRGPGPVFKLAVCLFFLFLLILVMGKIKFRFSIAGVLMVLYATFALSSTLWSVDPNRSLTFSIMLVQLLCTTWITVSCIEDEKSLNVLIWCLVLSSIFPSVALIHDYLTGGNMSAGFLGQRLKDYGDRMTFGDADPNLFAYRFVVSLLAAVHLALNSSSRAVRLILSGLIAAFTATFLMAGSRGGMITLVVSSMALLLANSRHHLGPVLLTTIGLATILTVSIPYLPESVSSRYLGMSEEVASGTMSLRKNIYQEASGTFEQRPLIGVGYFAFQTASRQHGGLGLAAHNDSLQILLDLGLFGFGIYFFLMGTLSWEVFTTVLPWKGLAIGLFVAYCVSALSITLLAAKLPWITFGIILGAALHRNPAVRSWPENRYQPPVTDLNLHD